MMEAVHKESILQGMEEAEILLILEEAAGVSIAGFRGVPAGGGHRGADQQLVRFAYTTQGRQAGETTLFVKRCVWKGKSEAVHYGYFAANGVPTPRLYGAVRDKGGDEIIFLEWLPRISFRSDSEAEWRSLLSLLARLNACPITPDYARHLHPYEQIGAVGGGLWISGLDARPTDSEIETSLRLCDMSESQLRALCRAARTLFEQVAAQPQGLLHQDFMPDNVGWRGDEMVVFDLHKNAIGPRFADVAPYLAVPDWSKTASFFDEVSTGSGDLAVTRRESLTRHYLEEYARCGGPVVSSETFREETTALSWAHKITCLGWLVEEKQTARVREVAEFLRG